MWHIAQPLETLGQVALEPAAHSLLACANDLGDGRGGGGQAPLGGQSKTICARLLLSRTSRVARYRSSKAASRSGPRAGISMGFIGASFGPQAFTPLGINLFALRLKHYN
jgi:hypothetical protein